MTAAWAHDYDAVADVIYRGRMGCGGFWKPSCRCCGPGDQTDRGAFRGPAQGLGFVEDTGEYGYHMAMAALNMMEKIAFNALAA